MGPVNVITVLIVDAQVLFADVVASALARKHPVTVLDERPCTATEAIEAAAAEPEVALVDYWLDLMPAKQVTEAMLARSPSTKLIQLSWHHGSDDVDASLSAGAVGFLPKSVGIDHVAEAVYRADAGERPVFAEQLTALAKTIQARQQEAVKKVERFASLSARELEVVKQLAEGLSIDEVADRLGISPWTVRTHVRNLLPKTGARTQLEAVAMAHGAGLAWRVPRSRPDAP
jgi:DNA-binding NarL/FixJ family response regulator